MLNRWPYRLTAVF